MPIFELDLRSMADKSSPWVGVWAWRQTLNLNGRVSDGPTDAAEIESRALSSANGRTRGVGMARHGARRTWRALPNLGNDSAARRERHLRGRRRPPRDD